MGTAKLAQQEGSCSFKKDRFRRGCASNEGKTTAGNYQHLEAVLRRGDRHSGISQVVSVMDSGGRDCH